MSHDDSDARREAARSFNIARAEAINEFANLERSLARLFAVLLQSDDRKAYLVFAQLRDMRSRLNVLKQLLELSYGKQFQVFLASLEKQLMSLSTQRNKIVHWIALHSIRGGKKFNPSNDFALHEHPNMFGTPGKGRGVLRRNDLTSFVQKTRFLSSVIFRFHTFLQVGDIEPDGITWTDIFSQSIPYPPPADHPLFSHFERMSNA